ncbi:membrane protein [Mesorhizobium sp. L-8-10]|uniref:HdeD family acid-resistance protein n=1 Tax=unclassified Mesorhizobium TaxID=325217 RepID=UPI001926793D|nr:MULTISPECIES: DUF308 domain-containing protein [unclassified Mesorhizobium]BCH24147.1 membrane protein [Mesorhizobium sp. L-8-3]BCH31881.1 membrane protein [Mesorhizobium sp. L-8-10]
MATNPMAGATGNRLADMGVRWGWLLALGILMVVLGVIGLGMTYQLTLVAMFWLGAFAIIGGIAQVLDGFHHREWKSVAWHVIIGIIYVAAGILLIVTPVASAFWLTLFLAVSLVVTGIIRIVMAFQVRGHGSAWIAVLLSGLVSIVLGFVIYGTVVPPGAEALATPEGQLEWVRSWGWVIGLFVAIELIMEGAALIAIALGVKGAQEAPRS